MQMDLGKLGFDPKFSCAPTFLNAGERAPIVFRGHSSERHPTGLLLRVRTDDGLEWCGLFETGQTRLSVAYCAPSPEHLCVVAGGIGYIVRVTEPSVWWHANMNPVVDVCRVPDNPVVLVIGFSDIEAFSPEGPVWLAEAVSLDGLRIDSISNQLIRGTTEGDDVSPGIPFEVDVRTGYVRGGYIGYLRSVSGTASGIPDEAH